jgi:hypothetical protein
MGDTALASILHVTGRPLPSHHNCRIVFIQLPSFNCRPPIAAIVVINILAVSRGGGIIAIAIAITIAVTIAVATAAAVTVAAITIIGVIVDVAFSMLFCHNCHLHAPWQPIGGIGQNQATAALPMACERSNFLCIGYRYKGGKALLGQHYVHDVILLKISLCLSDGG